MTEKICNCELAPKNIRLEADFATDPVWCSRCNCSLDLSFLPISEILAEEVRAWGNEYGSWIDLKKDALVINGLNIQEKFNLKGSLLRDKLSSELGVSYFIEFKPSNSAELYNNS